MTKDLLFNDRSWHQAQESQRTALLDKIERINEDRLLSTPTEDLCTGLFEEYRIQIPVLHPEQTVIEPRERKVSTRYLAPIWIEYDGDGPEETAIEYIVELPFNGDAGCFQIQPTLISYNPPRARVNGSTLSFSVLARGLEDGQIGNEIRLRTDMIVDWLENLRADVEGWNSKVIAVAREHIEIRKDRILKARKTVASLGFTLKVRADAPKTYAVPVTRRKIPPPVNIQAAGTFTPEPALDRGEYENILSIIQNMVLVMERSPKCFRKLNEDAIRSHFLVQLNGQYEGNATGETFNALGKTDILIRDGNRNIFIAECKFWQGQKKLQAAIDQLLGYCTWRDTKTAIVLLNRKTQFSIVLTQIPETVRKHPCFKRELPGSTETVFRYLFANPVDQNREIFLTILAFDVPMPGVVDVA